MIKKIAIGITSLILLVVLAVLLWQGKEHSEQAAQLPDSPLDAASAGGAVAPPGADSRSDPPGLLEADEVDQQEVDGDFLLDADGHLIVTEDARHIFDYFLSLGDEDSKLQTRRRLMQFIETQLADPAKGEALGLLDRYLQFKQSIADLNADKRSQDWLHNGDFSAAHARLQQVKNLRRQYFSEEETLALFGAEEAYDEFSLRRLEVLRDTSLAEAEKAKQIQQLREQLPDAVRQAVEPQLQQELEEKTETLREAGAPETDVRKLREQMVGQEAAARLEALDKETAAWNERLELFRAEKKKILENNLIAEDTKQQMIETLLEARFSELERQRVEALESE